MQKQHRYKDTLYSSVLKLMRISHIQGCQYQLHLYEEGGVTLLRNDTLFDTFIDVPAFCYYVEGQESMVGGVEWEQTVIPLSTISFVTKEGKLLDWDSALSEIKDLLGYKFKKIVHTTCYNNNNTYTTPAVEYQTVLDFALHSITKDLLYLENAPMNGKVIEEIKELLYSRIEKFEELGYTQSRIGEDYNINIDYCLFNRNLTFNIITL